MTDRLARKSMTSKIASLIKAAHVRALTLVEMLLVVAVLATISVAGVQMQLIKAESVKIEKTYLDMQNIMMASRAYYELQSSWPKFITSLSGMYTNLAKFTQFNTYGDTYTFTSTEPNYLTTRVPSRRVASGLVARLPFSYYEASGSQYEVRALLTVPSRTGWLSGGLRIPVIVDIEDISITPSTTLPITISPKTCPNDTYDYKWAAGLKEFGHDSESSDSNDRVENLSSFSLCYKESKYTMRNYGTGSDGTQCRDHRPSGDNQINLRVTLWTNEVDTFKPWATLTVIHYCVPKS